MHIFCASRAHVLMFVCSNDYNLQNMQYGIYSNAIGLVKDDKTLRQLNVTSGAKMMVVGSTLGDVITVQPPSPEELKEEPQAEGQQDHQFKYTKA